MVQFLGDLEHFVPSPHRSRDIPVRPLPSFGRGQFVGSVVM